MLSARSSSPSTSRPTRVHSPAEPVRSSVTVNTAVHREVIAQLYAILKNDGFALRFELAKNAPQPLSSDTTWRLDRISPKAAQHASVPTSVSPKLHGGPIVASGATNVNAQQGLDRKTAIHHRGSVAAPPSCSATIRPGPSSSFAQAPDTDGATTRARGANQPRSTPPKLPPNLLAKFAKSLNSAPASRATSTVEQQFAALTLEWQALKKKSDDLDEALTAQTTRHAKELTQLKAEHSAAFAKVRFDMAAEQGDHARLDHRLRHERDKALAEKHSSENRCSNLSRRKSYL